MKLSVEQAAIVMSRGPIRVNAVAGSGKTTTLVEYARSRKGRPRILYLAFNRSIRDEAADRFWHAGVRNVRTETAHSLAFKSVAAHGTLRVVRGYRPPEVARIAGIRARDEHTRSLLAVHTLGFLQYYWNSGVERLHSVNYAATLSELEARQFADRHAEDLIGYSVRMLEAMNAGRVACLHDHYLKQFQLQRPVLPYDYLLFDEGQDASAVMLDVVTRQRAVQVIVGDEHQQIYGWRHACNALQQCPYPAYTLSTSYRFHEQIARLARAVLSWKGLLHSGQNPVQIKAGGSLGHAMQSKAVVARSHVGLLGKAIDWLDQGGSGMIRFEGGLPFTADGSTYATIRDLLALKEGNRTSIQDPILSAFGNLDELEAYLKKADHTELNTLTELVRLYGTGLIGYLQRLEKAARLSETSDRVDLVFGTVHRCKGLEFDQVDLAGDFVTLSRIKRQLQSHSLSPLERNRWMEEVNLLYVAITRARMEVRLPKYIWRDLLSSIELAQATKAGHLEGFLVETQTEHEPYFRGYDEQMPKVELLDSSCAEPKAFYSDKLYVLSALLCDLLRDEAPRLYCALMGHSCTWVQFSWLGLLATVVRVGAKKPVFLSGYARTPQREHQQGCNSAQQQGWWQSRCAPNSARLYSIWCRGNYRTSSTRRASYSSLGCVDHSTCFIGGVQYGRQSEGAGVYRFGISSEACPGYFGAGCYEPTYERPWLGCGARIRIPDRYGGHVSGSWHSNVFVCRPQSHHGRGSCSYGNAANRVVYRILRAFVPP